MKSFNQIIKSLQKPDEIKLDVSTLISKQIGLPLPIVKKGIKQGLMTINNKPFHFHEIILRKHIILKFQGVKIETTEITKSDFDRFIEIVIHELNIKNLNYVNASSKKLLSTYAIAYFSNHSYDKVTSSENEYFDQIIKEFESFYREYFKVAKIPRKKELVETLIKHRLESLNDLNDLVNNLVNGFFSKNLFKFLQEYSKIFNQPGFQHCILPLLSQSFYTRAAIESLIKSIHDAQEKIEINEKFILYQENEEIFLSYISLLNPSSDIDKNIFKKIGEYLFSLFKAECQTLESKPAIIKLSSTPRKYNFNNPERDIYNLFINIQNTGEGLAREINIVSLSEGFIFDNYVIGVLKPRESRDISLKTAIKNKLPNPVLNVKCSWLESSNAIKDDTFDIKFGTQDVIIPWKELEKKKPYTIQEIEEKEKLYGRDAILKELKQNILSDKIESYKLWGQKRVGKSSIVKTLKTIFNNTEKVIVVWRSIAGLKNTDPILTLNTLGESLCSEIFEEIDRKISNSTERERLRSLLVPEFNGSLFPLENYIKKLQRLDPSLRFVFILDEFDRINEEFFLPGNIGDSFSLNIGKGLSSIKYVGFILVGSENMHLLDRQEINYNSFQEREIDTFNKKSEFDSFRQIIVGPVNPYILYSNEAVEKIYDITNGNPYFANLLCSHIFKICSNLKDNEVDILTTETAINIIVESSQKSHFEHFWVDGITEESSGKKERKADIRRRILVSYSLNYFQTKLYPVKEDIVKNFKKPVEYSIENYEITNTVTEFFNRKIFFEESNGIVRIKPSLFEKWLCGPGRLLMIEGVPDLEALQREKQLEAEHALKQEELERISQALVFQGQKPKVADFLDYFRQFGGPFEQRRIFNLINSIYYISKSEIIDFIKREKKNIFRKSELELKDKAKTPYRENVELYSFSRTIKENVDIVDSFKRFSFIRSSKTLKDITTNKDAWKNSGSDDIIIFESVIDNFSDVQSELLNFLDEKLISAKVPVKLFVLLITTKAKADLIKATSPYSNFKIIHFKEIEESKIKPFIDTTEVFKNQDEVSYAFAEVRKHLHSTSKNSLNVLFESHCPSKTIPIFWHSTKQFKPIFPNPSGSIYIESKDHGGEADRDRVYHATKEFIQAINPFLINYLKVKANKDGVEGDENWFRTPYVPTSCIKSITEKWLSENCQNPKETYFDLIHYKEVIRSNKELLPTFEIHDKKSGGNGLEWFEKLNEIRRTAAHQEKAPPSPQDADYFERKKNEIIKRIVNFKIGISETI